MNIAKQHHGLSKTLIGLAVLASFGPAQAEEEDDLAQHIKPESSVSIGLGGTSGDSQERALFGQYNGMRHQNGLLLLDIDYTNREEMTGNWMILKGHNLGLSDRDLLFSQEKQGDWRYSAEYSQLSRYYPRTINTGMLGVGTTTPTIVALPSQGSGADLDFKTQRERIGLGIEKWLAPSLQLEANFKTEDKTGARLFGRGLNCSATASIVCSANSGALLLLPEPINSTTRQIEAKLNFSGEKFLLSGGYYGSFYNNSYGSLNPSVSGNLWQPNGAVLDTSVNPGAQVLGYMQQPIALPPDNQAHQLALSGNYIFTPKTRATFKYAYTHATQNDNFAGMGLTGGPAGVSDLGGKLDSTLAQFGVTTRPTTKLSLLANLRYENREDKTPINFYSPTAGQTNTTSSLKKLNGKMEAGLQMPDNYRATLGVDYEIVNHGIPVSTYAPGGLTLLREETQEIGYRLELRRPLSETLTGAVSYITSRRDGSSWLNAIAGTPAVTDDVAAALASGRPVTPSMLMNRERDKVKLMADWSATNRLSLQFILEEGRDRYDVPHTGISKGLQQSGNSFYSIDAVLNISEEWKLTGYWAQSNYANNVNHSTYLAELETINTSVGIGVAGKPSSRFEVGGDISYMKDKNRYVQGIAVATTQPYDLPDVLYRLTSYKLFGKYALEKSADVRVDLIHQRAKLDEWTWGYAGVPFFVSDYTTVTMEPEQHVTFVGVSYIYKWQ